MASNGLISFEMGFKPILFLLFVCNTCTDDSRQTVKDEIEDRDGDALTMAKTHTKDITDILSDYARTHRNAAIAYLESDMFYTAKYEIEHAIALNEQRNRLLNELYNGDD